MAQGRALAAARARSDVPVVRGQGGKMLDIPRVIRFDRDPRAHVETGPWPHGLDTPCKAQPDFHSADDRRVVHGPPTCLWCVAWAQR